MEKPDTSRLRPLSQRALAALACLALGTSSWPAFCQTGPAAPDLHLAARTVAVDVMVQDKRGGSVVDGLPASSFEILDNGEPQKVTYFSHGGQTRPLAVMLIVDEDTLLYSASFYENVLPPAIANALSQLRPADSVGLMVAMTLQHDGVRTPDGSAILLQPTRDRQRLTEALHGMGKWIASSPDDFGLAKGYDIGKIQIASFLKAVETLQQDEPSSRAVVVFVGANANATAHVLYFDHGITQLKNTDATVCGFDIRRKGVVLAAMRALNPIGEADPTSRGQAAQHAAAATGGEMVKVEGDDFTAAFSKVLGDIESRYSLGFVPHVIDGKEHKLEVRVTPPGSANKSTKLVIHARQGYLASDAPPVPPTDSDTKHS